MIFYIGVAIIIAGIVSLIMFLIKVRRPKAEAYIEDITREYYEKDKNQIKKHPHGHIKYVYRSIEYKALVLLLKRKMNIGDQITVSFKEESPEKPTMYAPKQELITVIVLWAIGIGVIAFCIFSMDYFDLW